jgi:hypothetical protein
MTTYTITETDLQNAVEQLMLSGRGQTALKQLVKWLDDAGLGLDSDNQDAVLLLLQAAWGPFPGTAPDLMRDATRPRKRRAIAREM